MPKFCPNCRNQLEALIRPSLPFYCRECDKENASTPKDTLVASFSKESYTSKFSELVRNAAKNPITKKTFKHCDKCGRDIMSLIRVGEDDKTLYRCICESNVSYK
jgi:DNA-directed RNA polymerase subunit M/transcription elongation factor TFIIS